MFSSPSTLDQRWVGGLLSLLSLLLLFELILLLNNENIIVQSFSNTFSTSIQGYNELEILIPPFSLMELTLKVAGGTPPTICQAMFQGRVYR